MTICGFTKRLNIPITKDKDGKTREKPLKSINQGNKGLEILTANKNKPLKLRNIIIIAESILDSLSLLQMGKFKPEETLLISTSGNFNLNENKKNLDFFLDKAVNANNRILAFDNDEQGKKYTQFYDYLNERIRMQKEPQFRNNSAYIPFSKDCNDDLLLKNITKLEKLTQKGYDDWCWNKIMELNRTKQSIPRMQMLKQLRKVNDLNKANGRTKQKIVQFY